MGTFLSYSIISGILMLAMYLSYRLFLSRDNLHSFNRAVLLSIYAISFLAIPRTYLIKKITTASTTDAIHFDDIQVLSGISTPTAKPVWGTILIWIFIAGMSIVLIKTLITWIRLSTVIRSGQKIDQGQYTLVVTDNERYAPFSWMTYVVISRHDYGKNSSAIIAHEIKHVASCHWIDLLIAQIVCIINWFNPAAWLMRDELMLVHEYQADMAVIDSGHDAQEYQMLLIEKAVGSRFPSLANSLNHSNLKKRITMMYKEKSRAGRRFKALALVPMLALAVGVVSAPAIRAAISTISNSAISVSEDSKKASDDKIAVTPYQVTNISKDGQGTSITIKGIGIGNHLSVTGATFATDGKTFEANSIDCSLIDGNATITANFKLSGEYKNPTLTLIINGEEVPFDLSNFFNDSQIVVVGVKSIKNSEADVITIKKGKSASNGDPDIYIDGEKATTQQVEALPTESISAIIVDKQNNRIDITTKK